MVPGDTLRCMTFPPAHRASGGKRGSSHFGPSGAQIKRQVQVCKWQVDQRSAFLLGELIILLFLSPLVFLKSISLGSVCF